MSVEPKPDLSEFAQFADTLRGHCAGSERVVRHALGRAVDRLSVGAREDVCAEFCALHWNITEETDEDLF